MNHERVLRIAQSAKPILQYYFSRDSCINSTRVMLEVFTRLDVPAEPCCVLVQVYSAGFMARAERENRMPESREELLAWLASDPKNIYSVGVGFGAPLAETKWPGHLALRVDGSSILDVTIDQASRPDHGLVIPGIVMLGNIPQSFWDGVGPNVVRIVAGNCMWYSFQPNNKSYLQAKGWRMDCNAKSIVSQIVTAAKVAEALNA